MQHGWTVDQATWDRLPDYLGADGRWRSVGFTLSDANSVPSMPGIYALCAPPPGRRRPPNPPKHDLFGLLFTAMYVGRTENLRGRFQQHCQNPSPEISRTRDTFKEGLEFWFCQLSIPSTFPAEACMIDCLGPTANLKRGTLTGKLQRPQSADSRWGNQPRR